MVNNYFLHKNPRKGNNFFAHMQIKSFGSMILFEKGAYLVQGYHKSKIKNETILTTPYTILHKIFANMQYF